MTNYSSKSIDCKEVFSLVKQAKENPKYTVNYLIQNGGREVVVGMISRTAALYGGVEFLEDDVKEECLKQVYNKFQKLNIAEIKEAYSLFAAGDLGEIYTHTFSPKQFVAVLSAYVEKVRRKALVEYYDEQERKARQQAKKVAQKRQEEYERTFPEMIREQRGKEWEEMRSYWYDTAIRLAIIDEPAPETKWSAMARAKAIYLQQQQDKPALIEGTFRAISIKAYEERVRDSTIKTIAKQILLAELL